METEAIVNGRAIPGEVLVELAGKVRERGELSRTGLSRWLCDRLGWIGDNGRRQEVTGRTALNELEKRGLIVLPAPRATLLPRSTSVARPAPQVGEPIVSSLLRLGELSLVVVKSANRELNEIWKGLMAHHYLGAGPLVGAQMRYLVKCERGWVAALAFSASARHVAARDKWIGWSTAARTANRKYVVCNSRFLIAPWVRVPELASKVLSLCAQRLARDWKSEYGYEPVLIETYVDKERFRGTCYRAANWVLLGATLGRGRQDRDVACVKSIKDVYALPLCRKWMTILCAEPPRIPKQRVLDPVDWAEEEFGGADLGDERLSKRLVELGRAFYARPQASIPLACGTLARTKAAVSSGKSGRPIPESLAS